MSVFEQLSKNKGTVSSALGKSLAQKILAGRGDDILAECIDLACYAGSGPTARNIRAGAGKVVELVAEKKPEAVAPHVQKLLPALAVEEPQTRWVIIRTLGYCARLNPGVARKGIAHAERYIGRKEGLVIASSADLFLGDLGAVSRTDASAVFPLLERSMRNAIKNEEDWLLEALLKVLPNLAASERKAGLSFAKRWQHSARKSTQARATKVLGFGQ